MDETTIPGSAPEQHVTEVNVTQYPKEKRTSMGKTAKVAIGAGGGILLGSIGVLASDVIMADEVDSDPDAAPVVEPEDPQGPVVDLPAAAVIEPVEPVEPVEEPVEPVEEPAVNPEWVDDQVDIADSVNDEMSFSEAFKAARMEVGAGGAFVWRGDVYSTYTAEEWDNMSAEQKDEYNDHFDWSAASDSQEIEEDDDISAPVVEIDEDELEVELLGVDMAQDDDVIIADVVMDDNEVLFIDVDPSFDESDEFDVMIADFDQDGIIDDDEIIDISDCDVNVEQFASDLNVDDDFIQTLDLPMGDDWSGDDFFM